MLTSQWLSRNVKIGAVAASAPRTRDRIKPVAENVLIKKQLVKMLTIPVSYLMRVHAGGPRFHSRYQQTDSLSRPSFSVATKIPATVWWRIHSRPLCLWAPSHLKTAYAPSDNYW